MVIGSLSLSLNSMLHVSTDLCFVHCCEQCMVHRRQINKEAMQREAGMRDHIIIKERKLMHKSMHMHSDFGFKLASQFLVRTSSASWA